jgi:hypothetical protein
VERCERREGLFLGMKEWVADLAVSRNTGSITSAVSIANYPGYLESLLPRRPVEGEGRKKVSMKSFLMSVVIADCTSFASFG